MYSLGRLSANFSRKVIIATTAVASAAAVHQETEDKINKGIVDQFSNGLENIKGPDEDNNSEKTFRIN